MSVVWKTGEIADALTGALSSYGWPARRVWVPSFDVSELATLRVLVTAAGDVRELNGRSTNREAHSVFVCVAKAVKLTEDNAELDALALQVEKLKALWSSDEDSEFDNAGALRNEALAGARFLKLDNDPTFEADKLIQKSQFVSIVTLTYTIVR